MRLITKNIDYAMRALCYIARKNDSVVSVSELTKKLRIPRPYLRKILQILNKRRILKSFKGQGGGFMLARPPEKIFLTNLIGIFQGSVVLSKCVIRKRICPDVKTCLLKKKVEDIEKNISRELSSVTIASLIKYVRK